MSRENNSEDHSANSGGFQSISSSQYYSSPCDNMETHHQNHHGALHTHSDRNSLQLDTNDAVVVFSSPVYTENQLSPQTFITIQSNTPSRELNTDTPSAPNPSSRRTARSRNNLTPEQRSRGVQASRLSRVRRREREQALNQNNQNLMQKNQKLKEQNHCLEQEKAYYCYQNHFHSQSCSSLIQPLMNNCANSPISVLSNQRQSLNHQMRVLNHQINQLRLEISEIQSSDASFISNSSSIHQDNLEQ